jgi:hypothetical protein
MPSDPASPAGSPAPTDPVPADPVPADPVPADPVPADPASAEATPGRPILADPIPADPIPADPTLADPTLAALTPPPLAVAPVLPPPPQPPPSQPPPDGPPAAALPPSPSVPGVAPVAQSVVVDEEAEPPWRPSPAVGAAAVMVLGTLGVLYLVNGATFYADDYISFSLARGQSLGSYMVLGAFGHFIPLWRLANWALVTWAPYRWWPAALAEVVVYLAAVLLTWRLLKLLFGASWAAVALLAVAALSVLYVPSTLWWSAALGALPMFAMGVLTIDAFVRFDMTRRWRHLPVLTVAYAVGLGFFDSMMLVVLVLVLFTALFLCAGTGVGGIARGLLGRWPAWLCLAVPSALDLGYRFTHRAEFSLPPAPSVAALLHYLGIAWSQGVMPGSLGLQYPDLVANAALATVVGQVVFVALVVVSLVRRPQAWRAWVLFGVTLVVLLAVTGETRVADFGPPLGLDYRYLTQVPVLSMLALGLAFLPLRPAVAPGRTLVTTPVVPRADRPPVGSPIAPPPPTPVPLAHRPALRPAVAVGVALVVVAYLVAAGFSTERVAAASGPWRAERFISTFAASQSRVQAADPGAFLYNYSVPFVPPAFFPYNLYSHTLAQMVPGLPLNRTAGQGYVAVAGGSLVPAVLTADPGELDSSGVTATGGSLVRVFRSVCDVTTTAGLLTVPLSQAVPAQVALMHLSYAVNQPTTVSVVSGTGSALGVAILGRPTLDLASGSGSRLENLVLRPIDEIGFLLPAGRTFCLSGLDVGVPVPAAR